MKTNLFSRLVLAASLLLTLFASHALSAQNCPGKSIRNTTGCPVIVNYSSDCNLGSVCNSGSGITINPGAIFNVPALCTPACGTGICRLVVTLTDVNGTTLGTPVTVTSINQNGTYSASLCPGSTGTITWGFNQVTIQ